MGRKILPRYIHVIIMNYMYIIVYYMYTCTSLMYMWHRRDWIERYHSHTEYVRFLLVHRLCRRRSVHVLLCIVLVLYMWLCRLHMDTSYTLYMCMQ